jgi:PEP-CTERM motif
MKLNLKALAAAAAVLCGGHAFAGINTSDSDAELFVVVWDETKATYVLDTGFTLGTLLNQGAATSWAFSVTGSANYAAYAAEDGNLADFSQFEGTRWALFAVDNNDNFNFDGKDRNYLTSTTFNAPMPSEPGIIDATLGAMGDFVLTQAQNGLTPDVAVNGDSFNKIGSPAHFLEFGYGGNFGIFAGNAIGDGIAKLSLCSYDLSTLSVPCLTKNGAGLDMQATFDGSTLSVTAVPEPGTYALLLAGLATVGFIARRRKA